MNYPSLPKTQRSYEHKIWPHKIKYSAFTAGQQSLLLQVADPQVPMQERIDTMSQVFGQSVDAGAPFSALPLAIVEKIFLLMREIAIGEIMKLRYGCKAQVDSEDGKGKESCGQELVVPVNLSQVDILIDPEFKKDFELSGDIWIRMRLPTYQDALSLANSADIPLLFATFTECLFDENQSWPVARPDEEGISLEERKARQVKFDEFREWVSENIDSVMINTIKESFFDKLPSIHYKTEVKCPKCGTMHPIEFTNLNQIFI